VRSGLWFIQNACSCVYTIAEFNNAGCLLISEVRYLLENRDKDAPDTPYVVLLSLYVGGAYGSCSVYNKTLEYVKTFAKFNTTDATSAVRECVRRREIGEGAWY